MRQQILSKQTVKTVFLKKHLILLIVILTSLQLALPTFAAPPELSLEIVPDSIELLPDKEATVTVVLRNPSDQTVTNVRISTFTNTAVQIAVKDEQANPITLPPNGSIVWELGVQQSNDGPNNGNVFVRIDYQWETTDLEGSNVTPVDRVLIDQFAVAVSALPDPSEVAGVEVSTTLAALNQQRPGTVLLILENKKDVPLTLDVEPQGPSFIKFSREGMPKNGTPAEPINLKPREKGSVPYIVSAQEVVQPGKHLLVFKIGLSWEEEGQARESTLITTHEVDVGVFGESQILTLLGIPAFFLLPGFLLLIVLKLLWSFQKRGQAQTTVPAFFDIKNKPAEFTAIAITVSLIVMWFYPIVTQQLLGVRRSYLGLYGLDDVFYVWFGSIVLAVLLFAFYIGGQQLWRWWLARQLEAQARQLKARTPKPGDNEITTIEKLKLNGLNLQRKQAWVKIGGESYLAFVLQGDRESESLWVAPPICIKNRDELTDKEQNAVYAAQPAETLDEFMTLLPRLRLKWRQETDAEVFWPKDVSIPYKVERNEVESFVDDPGEKLVEFC
jgi:hypothetical protein